MASTGSNTDPVENPTELKIPHLYAVTNHVSYKDYAGNVIAKSKIGTIPINWPGEDLRLYHSKALEYDTYLFVLESNKIATSKTNVLVYFNRTNTTKCTIGTMAEGKEELEKQLAELSLKYLVKKRKLPEGTQFEIGPAQGEGCCIIM